MPALYHCHKCNQQCTVTCENNGELKCTRCNESFVERISDTQAGGDGPTSSTAAANRVPSGPRVEVNPFGMFPTSPFSQLFQNVAQQLPDPDTQPTTSSAAAQRSGSGGALATPGNGPPPPNQDQQPSGSQAQQQQAEEEEEDEDQPQGADDNETMVRLLHGVFVNIVDQATGVGEAANAAAPGPSNDAAAVTPSGRNVTREPINNNNGAGGGGGGLVARGPAIFIDRGQGHMPVHRPGNMEARLRSDIGNYAFGPNGLDDILTQLLNEASEAEERARALQPEDILRIPMLTVTEEHVINDAQCSTCMDNFIMGEEVAKLDCEHIFHLPCIQPWFERKNTCPICRKEVDPSKWPPAAGPPNNGEGSSGGGGGGGGEPKLTE